VYHLRAVCVCVCVRARACGTNLMSHYVHLQICLNTGSIFSFFMHHVVMIYGLLQVTYRIYIPTTYLFCFLSVSLMGNVFFLTFARYQQWCGIGSWGRVVSLAMRLWAGRLGV